MRLGRSLTLFLFITITSVWLPPDAPGSCRIRSVDFDNLTQGSESPKEDVQVVPNEDPHWGWGETRLVSVHYADFDGDGNEEAFVYYLYVTSAQIQSQGDYYLYACRNGKLKKLWHVTLERPLLHSIRGKQVTLRAPYWLKDDPHCCPSQLEIVTYSWRNGRFRAIKRELRPYPSP